MPEASRGCVGVALTLQELLGTVKYTHVLNRGGKSQESSRSDGVKRAGGRCDRRKPDITPGASKRDSNLKRPGSLGMIQRERDRWLCCLLQVIPGKGVSNS